MFNKIFKFLKGYVIIEIYGLEAARFVNICLRRGIDIWNVLPAKNSMSLCVRKSDFGKIRSVARKTRVRVKIRKKVGLYNLFSRYRKRYFFIIGLVMTVLFFAVSSRYIWVVEINGAETIDMDKLVASLDSIGVKSGALKKSLPPGTEIKRRITDANEGVAWAWVYIEGAKARVEISEKILKPDVIDRSAYCDIAAACGGVIKKVTAKNGAELVKPGDAVSAGDVLISGRVPVYKEGQPEKYMYVHALGEVEAYTSHSRTGDYKLYYESRNVTGRGKTFYSLELFGKRFDLFRSMNVDYDDYNKTDKRNELNINGYSGICLNSTRFDEVLVNREPITVDTALEIARNKMEAEIAKELQPESQLLGSDISYEQIDDETIRVTLNMSFIEKIGIESTGTEGTETQSIETENTPAQ